jgi:hypothetical protein
LAKNAGGLSKTGKLAAHVCEGNLQFFIGKWRNSNFDGKKISCLQKELTPGFKIQREP